MALNPLSGAVSVAFGTVSFFMADDERKVRVDIPKDLLARIEGTPLASKEAYIKRLMRHRQLFAQIAGVKYDDGHYEHEVNVLVVRITEDDLS